MSVASSVTVCNNSVGPTASDLQQALVDGTYSLGLVGLGRFQAETLGISQRSDFAFATFYRFGVDQSSQLSGDAVLGSTILPPGSCVVTQFQLTSEGTPFLGAAPGSADLSFLDAGQVSLSGPPGTFNLNNPSKGFYSLVFVPGAPGGMPGVVGAVLSGGNYTFAGAGGTEVGPFAAPINVPVLFDWTNRGAISIINTAQPLNITWSGGTAGSFVTIVGFSITGITDTSFNFDNAVGATFACWADAAAGFFTVPARVLNSMPPTATAGGVPFGQLIVSSFNFGDNFFASGIDVGLTNYFDGYGKTVTFQSGGTVP